MSGRPTADERTPDEEMVYWLHADATWITLPYPKEAERIHKAADRLAELDAEVKAERQARYEWSRRATESAAALFNQDREVDALRPPCPKCGGKGYKPMLTDIGPNPLDYKCPDCVDGKVSVERLAALWNAVWDMKSEAPRPLTPYAWHRAVQYLRAVKA